MKINISPTIYEKIKNIAKKNGFDLVVLFGSQISGRIHSESDIDIGIYSSSGILWDKTNIIAKEFSEIFKSNNIDLNIISSNNPVLMNTILTTGTIVYESEKDVANNLKLYSWKLVAESKSFRDRVFELLKARVANITI